LVQQGYNDVLDGVGVVVDCKVVQVPVLDHKEEMTFYSDLVNNWLSDVEGVGHDCDQHVQHMDNHGKSCDKEDDVKRDLRFVAVF